MNANLIILGFFRNTMGTLDIILLACFIPALIQGISKGFIEQLVGIASLIIAAFASFALSSKVYTYFAPSFPDIDPKLFNVICFAVVALVAVILVRLLFNVILKFTKDATLSLMNRLLGLVFSVFKAALIIGLLITVFESINNHFELVKPSVLGDSVMYTAIKEFTGKIFPFIKDLINGIHA